MLVDAALRSRSTVFFLMVAVALLGLSAYQSLPREKYPDIDVPLILVYVPYPGAAPSEVETQITNPLERELTGLAGLEELTSVSQEGLSVVTCEFSTDTVIDDALQKVRDRVDQAEVDFPEDAEESVLREVNFADFPVLQVNLAGDVGPVVLKQLAEDLQDEIETIPGVLRANLVGGLEREVQVDVDPEKLRLYGLAFADVSDAVRDGNLSIPGGDLELGDLSYAVRVPGEVDDPLAVADFVIKAEAGRPIFVRDVAEVRFGFEERTSYARIDGRESVALAVQKRLGANIIEVNDAVKERVAQASVDWPEGVEAAFLGDLSRDIRIQVKDLENSILSGLLLVLLVLMFALGLRNAFFVALAIPFSMLITFLVIQWVGVTLNMVVLFALVLAVGMLVDNAVVVIENIYRHLQGGLPRLMAASVGTREVGGAIAVSTFTTLGAFAPLISWPGVIGDFMSYLPWTVSLALLASLVVAFTVNPVLCSTFMKAPRQGGESEAAEADEAAGDAGEDASESSPEDSESTDGVRDGAEDGLLDGVPDGRIVRGYRRLLEWSLDHRAVVVLGTFLLFGLVLTAFVVLDPGVELLPEEEPIRVLVDLDLAPGSRLEKTDQVIRELEDRLTGLTDVTLMASGVGEGSRDDGFGGSSEDSVGRVSLDLVARQQRQRSGFDTLAEVRRLANGIPGATLDVDQPREGPQVGDPLSVELTGDDFEVLGQVAARVRGVLEGIPGLVSLDDDFDLARPEVVITVDRVEAARLGLTVADVAGTLRTAVQGDEASTYRRGDEEIDIRVRLGAADRSSLDSLKRLTIVNEDGVQVPLESVARLERSAALTAIRHDNRQRRVTVSGKVETPRLAVPVREEARRRLAEVPDLLPPGVRLEFGGQEEEEEESKAFLRQAFAYAVVLVLAMIVGKFDSLAIPGIILTSVAMSMIGVLLGLLVTGMPFSIIMTGVGVISLAGIVVNNAIVLLDYAEQLRRRGLARRQVVVLTGVRRLRPVLLTAVTTILGLLPLTTGVELDFRTLTLSTGSESSQYWGAMGVAVVFGLAFATFLTLVLVPVLYDLLLGYRERWGSKDDRALPEGV